MSDFWSDPQAVVDKIKAMPDLSRDSIVFDFLGGMCLGALNKGVDEGILAAKQLPTVLEVVFELVGMGYKLGRLEAESAAGG